MNGLKDNHSTGSYVVSRIPNLIGSGQRKIIDKPKEVIFSPDSGLEKCNDNSDILEIDVCLRVKPQTNNIPTEQDTLTILSDNSVACSNRNARDDVTEFTFSSVFGPNIDQKTFFNTWVHDKVLRFLNGNSELLFAYGTTNAGKTYTTYGNLNDPGIIPRTLSLIFRTLNNKLMSQCKYKPDKVIAAHILADNLMKAEEDIRNRILNNWSTEKIQVALKSDTSQVHKGQTVHNDDQLTNSSITKMFDTIENNRNVFLNHGDVSYSVWVSYAEIYNESIYDLLISHLINQKQISLKLSLDKHKDVYVRDLTHVFVQSAEEAYKVLSFGRNNLKITSNTLNKSSNRSHCIFTIKLMRVENMENPETAVISSISFCDLAGSERLKKTMNVGDRLTESKNINTSLLVLNKCISVLRENQKRGENHLVPWRESKLTQMFQTALTGNTRTGISMTVNVDMSFGLFEETKQVLLMSAIVHSITKIKAKKSAKPSPSFAIWSVKNGKSISQSKSKQSLIIEDDENITDSNLEESMITKTDFEIRLEEEQVKLRKELISQFHTILDNNNTFHKNQKETIIEKKTKMYEDKIDRIRAYYLEEIQEIKNNLELAIIHHINTKNKNEIENYKFCVDELEMQKEELLAEIDVLKNIQNMRQEDINLKNKEIEKCQTMFEESNTKYEHLKADLNEMTNMYNKTYQELEEKNLEIAKLTGILEVKDNVIKEIKNHQDELKVEVSKTQGSNDNLLNSKLSGTPDMCGKSLDETIDKTSLSTHK